MADIHSHIHPGQGIKDKSVGFDFSLENKSLSVDLIFNQLYCINFNENRFIYAASFSVQQT